MKTKTQELINYYNKGHTQVETAKKFNCHPSNITNILHYYNIKTRKFDKTGKNNPKWKGGIMYDKNRKLIYSPNHPYPDFAKKYCYEYKLIMEKYLKRYLKKGEIVHHKNGDVTDNRIKNLQVMTQSEHIKIHRLNILTENKLKVHRTLKRNERGQWMKKII